MSLRYTSTRHARVHVLGLAVLLACGAAVAQQPSGAPAAAAAPAPAPVSAAKKELVAQVLRLQQPGIEGLAQQLAEQPARLMIQQVGPALQRVPQERREALARDIEADVRKYVEETAPGVRNRAVALAPTTIGAVLEQAMSEDELKEVIGILQSPANRKFQGLAGDMQRALGERLVAETRGDVEAKVRELQQSVERRLQSALPPAPAPAPAPSGNRAPAPAPAPAKRP